MNEDRITYFGQTDARNKKVTFGIKAKDRTKHVYVIGKTGMGKSTLLENMAVQDIKNGEGMAFIDPHGKTAELLLEYVPEHRQKDVVYFAPFDMENPISFNVLENVDADKRHLVVSGLMSTFKKIWQDAWSARMEYILTNTLLALLEYPGATLLGVNRMLSDKEFRKLVISHVTDSSVKSFWVQEFANYTERMAAEAVPAIQNKIGQFTANALIRNMIGQPKSSFDIRQMMDSSKVFIINLSKGRIGESNANLLGGMLITKIYLAALSRADVPDRVLKTLPNFYLFVDEFQSFANESFADILSEARKYKLNLTMAHQYIEQMEEEVRAAVFGNVGTMIVFRVGAFDAEVLEKEFAPQFTAEDIVGLGIFQIYLKLMIDGISSAPFSATTLPPIAKPESSSMERVIEESRRQFSKRRVDVEKAIDDWMQPIKPPPKEIKPPVAPTPVPVTKPVEIPKPQPVVVPKPPVVVPPPPKPFVNTQVALPKLKSVNLSSLTNTPKNNNHKDASPARVNELKSALASILASNPDLTKKGDMEEKQAKQNIPPVTQKKEIKNDTKREVSEDVLRDILKVE
jgi:energy-coupling factor transporter ATP-binding protein EcfA2